MKKEILSWVKTIILAVLLAFVVDTVFIVNATVPTGSMENTIMAGDRILALRTSYWFSDPERKLQRVISGLIMCRKAVIS